MRLHNKIQVLNLLNHHIGVYPTPMNINWNWSWGSLSGLVLASQIVTGILLAMHYVGHVDHAFSSVQHLMVDVPSGVILRYTHANGASLFFTVVYFHVLRGLYYSSGNQPREIVWISGVVILLLMVITAFIGYKCSLKYQIYDLIGHINDFLKNLSFQQEIEFTELIIILNGIEIDPVKKYENLHLIETQLKIAKDNRQKAGVYLIYNKINGNYYIGSAITNRLNVRFRYHCVSQTGGSLIVKAIRKYGLNAFEFYILKYFDGFVHKEDLKKSHLALLKIETNYINLLKPKYNILIEAGSSIGYKHTKETIDLMKCKFSEQRKEFIKNLNKGKSLSTETKEKLKQKAIERFLDPKYKETFLLANSQNLFKSKPIGLYDRNNQLLKEFVSITDASDYYKCDRKTVRKYLNKSDKFFRNLGFLKTL